MTNAVAIHPPRKSVLLDMATRFGMEPAAFQATVMATCMPSNTRVTNEQFAAFLLVAKEYGLNPLTKEIYAFPAKGGIQPMVSIDGWSNIINSHPAYDGMTFHDHVGESGEIVAITCRMHRKDRAHPIEATEYLVECRRPTEPWQKWPRRMLRHKAMIQAARYAFGFAGIYDPDEAERFAADTAKDVTTRQRPTLTQALDQIASQPKDRAADAPVMVEDPQAIAGEDSQLPEVEPEDDAQAKPVEQPATDEQDDDFEEDDTPRGQVLDAARRAATNSLKRLRLHLGKLTAEQRALLTDDDVAQLEAVAKEAEG